MNDTQKNKLDRISRYADLIQQQTGKAVRPYREDGWINLLNKYGTSRDTSEQYQYADDGLVPDETLSTVYEGNGLFARIIDAPAEEAVKHGFKLKGIEDHCIEDFYTAALDELDWDEAAITSVKWARLFGGSIAVMLINDGRRLEEPVDWRNIQSIDDIRVYDRSVVQPDYASIYSYDPRYPFNTRGSRLGMPEYYHVSSLYGSFTVHESRCLVFQNGVLPERTSSSLYRLWGMPEYVRIQRALRDSEVAHGSAVKMLDKSVQAVYKMKDLSMELSTDEGENRVLKRLQTIDMARGLMNSMVIDNEGEEYDFRTFQFTGVTNVIDSTCEYLSALTCIPQTILFGKAISGMSSTDDTSMENYYNFIERIQRRLLRGNLRYLLSVIFQAGVATGEVEKVPPINVEFNSLWSLNEVQQASLDLQKAQLKQVNASTAITYMQAQVLSPSEVRKSLVKAGDFEIDTTFDDDDMSEEEIDEMMEKIQDNGGFAPDMSGGEQQGGAPGMEGMMPGMGGEEGAAPEDGGNAPDAAPTATKLPQDMSEEEAAAANEGTEAAQQAAVSENKQENDSENIITQPSEKLGSVGVIVVKDGKILAAVRKTDTGSGLVCGPGGHIEAGETPEFAAARETSEEFGIIPNELIFIGRGEEEPETGFSPYIYLCTDYSGEPHADDVEMSDAEFLSLDEFERHKEMLFAPFASSLSLLQDELSVNFDAKNKKGQWITTKSGKHIHLNKQGKPDAGNPHVIAAMGAGNAVPKAPKAEEKNSGKTVDNYNKSGKIINVGKDTHERSSDKQNVSAQGENDSCVTFVSEAKLKDHFARHGVKEFGYVNSADYVAAAEAFLRQPCGGDVIGYSTPDGKIVRFNQKTTEYASGFPGKNICTYMKAKCGKGGKLRPKNAKEYYETRKLEDGGQ